MASFMKGSKCFCNLPCAVINTSKGSKLYKCGYEVNYKAIADHLKTLKGKALKDDFLHSTNLGCKFFFNEEDVKVLDPRLIGIHPKEFPLCDHNIFAKVGISHSEFNHGRVYFTCPTQYPDIPCHYFEWLDNLIRFDRDIDAWYMKDREEVYVPRSKAKKRRWDPPQRDNEEEAPPSPPPQTKKAYAHHKPPSQLNCKDPEERIENMQKWMDEISDEIRKKKANPNGIDWDQRILELKEEEDKKKKARELFEKTLKDPEWLVWQKKADEIRKREDKSFIPFSLTNPSSSDSLVPPNEVIKQIIEDEIGDAPIPKELKEHYKDARSSLVEF